MARIKIRSLTLCALLLALSCIPLAQASQQTRTTDLTHSSSVNATKKSKEKTRQQNSKNIVQKKTTRPTSIHKARAVNRSQSAAKMTLSSRRANKKPTAKVTRLSATKTALRSEKCTHKKVIKTSAPPKR